MTSTAATAALAKFSPRSSVSLTQWGTSPFNETAIEGVYAAPPALSDLAITEMNVAAKTLADSPARRLAARILGATALDAVIAATGGTSAASASQGLLQGAAPRPTSAVDLFPGRPLDSRVVSVSVNAASGEPAVVPRGVFPVNVTIPFRDLSIVKWDATLKTATIDVGNGGFAQYAIAITCPTSPQSAARGVTARFINGGIGAASVRLESTQTLSFTGVVGSSTAAATASEALGAVAAPDGTSVATDLLTLPLDNASSNVGDGAMTIGQTLSAKAPTAVNSAVTYLLSFDCGPAFGRQTFVCGAGYEGSQISFACPKAVAMPSCLRFNNTRRTWSTTGCAVSSTSTTSVVCACDAPGDFAVRFAALAQQQPDIFATGSPTNKRLLISVWWGAVGALCAFVLFNIAGVAIAGDDVKLKKWVARLSLDDEMIWLKIAAESRHGSWSLSSNVVARSSKVAPLVAQAPSSPTAKTIAISHISVGSAINGVSRSPPLNDIGAALERRHSPACVAPPREVAAAVAALSTSHEGFSDGRALAVGHARLSDLASVVGVWRAAVAKAAAEEGMRAPTVSQAALVRAVACTRILRGEPPAILIAAWSLLCARSQAFYDARGSASAAPPLSRVLGAIAVAASSGAGTCALYFYMLANSSTAAGSPELSALTAAQVVALATAAAVFVILPFEFCVLALLRARSRGIARSRFPRLWEELDRRYRASQLLSQLPTSALLNLVAGRVVLSADEAADVNAATPPGFTESLDEKAREDAMIAAANASFAAGIEGESTDPDEESVRLRSALSNLRAAFDDSTASSAVHPTYSWVNIFFVLFSAFGVFYVVGFTLARGAAATVSVVGAWSTAVVIFLVVIRPAYIFSRVALSFATRGRLRRNAGELVAYHEVLAATAAAAAAVDGVAAEAAAAMLHTDELAAAELESRSGALGAHLALRRTAYARAYLTLVAPPQEDLALAKDLPAADSPPVPIAPSDASAQSEEEAPSAPPEEVENVDVVTAVPPPSSEEIVDRHGRGAAVMLIRGLKHTDDVLDQHVNAADVPKPRGPAVTLIKGLHTHTHHGSSVAIPQHRGVSLLSGVSLRAGLNIQDSWSTHLHEAAGGGGASPYEPSSSRAASRSGLRAAPRDPSSSSVLRPLRPLGAAALSSLATRHSVPEKPRRSKEQSEGRDH